MTPRAMLAMREPCERKERGRKTKQKVSMTKFSRLAFLLQRNAKTSIQLMPKHQWKCQNSVRETERVGRASLEAEKLSQVAWEQGCWGKQATRIFWLVGLPLFWPSGDTQCALQPRMWPNRCGFNWEQEYGSMDRLQHKNHPSRLLE